MDKKTGILIVSFGTSHSDAAQNALRRTEDEVREAYPGHPVYHAWTSRMVRGKLRRAGIDVPGVADAMMQMYEDGISEIAVQPTVLLCGVEYGYMMDDINAQKGRFKKVSVGEPLLKDVSDGERMIRALLRELQPGGGDALVLMGHGSDHPVNRIYGNLADHIKEIGIKNVYIGTVEASPSLGDVFCEVSEAELRPGRIILAPFLMVAGDHAKNDLGGEGPDSWKSRFLAAGYDVKCILKGLGEYKDVRNMILEKLDAAVKGLER